jgi:hypothetical protein
MAAPRARRAYARTFIGRCGGILRGCLEVAELYGRKVAVFTPGRIETCELKTDRWQLIDS